MSSKRRLCGSRESGRTVDQVAQDLGVGKSTLMAWRRQLRNKAPAEPFDDPKKEFTRARRELETVWQLSHRPAQARARPHSPLRSRQPVLLEPVSNAAGKTRHSSVDIGQGQFLRQRRGRILFQTIKAKLARSMRFDTRQQAETTI